MLQDNPLDTIEDVLDDNNWVYTRMSHDEIRLDIRGTSCNYNVVFLWQDAIGALQLACEYDLTIHENNIARAYEAINHMNTTLLIGHFEFRPENPKPYFRHSSLMQRGDDSNIEDFVELSLMQCEQHQTVFQMLAGDTLVCPETLSFAMMDPLGES